MQHVAFYVWLLLLSIMFSRFLLAVARVSSSVLFMAKECSIVGIYHILFIHSLIDGPLSCFCFLAITYNAALNILVPASVWTCVWSS